MSFCNKYFLFYDTFYEKYGLWTIEDSTNSSLLKDLLAAANNKLVLDAKFELMKTKDKINYLFNKMGNYHT